MKNRIIVIIIIIIILTTMTLLTMNISDKEEKVESITSTTTQQTTTEITQEQTTTLAKAKKKKKSSKKKTKKKTKKKSTTKAKHTSSECKQYAYNELVDRYGWDEENDWSALIKLWNKESGWNALAKNKKSGACGIPQAYPCSKMKKYGKDYKTNCYTQINFGLAYISGKYGTPQKAWKHSQKKGWY